MRGEAVQGQEAPPGSEHDALRAAWKACSQSRASGWAIGESWSSTARPAQTMYERNADLLFAPASVTKLFSTAAALVELGPKYRFQTPLVRRGDVDVKGTLHGDVILVAQGDLAMGVDRARGDDGFSRMTTILTPGET